MTDSDGQPTLPAAWYPDPDDVSRLRWWDGAQWTQHVKELPPPPEELVSTPTAIAEPAEESPFLIKTSAPETRVWTSDSGRRYVPLSTRNDLPAELRDDNDDFDKDDDVGSSMTAEIWVLGLLPGIAFAAELGIARGTHIFDKNPLLFWIVPVAWIIANLIVVSMDRSTLASRNRKDGPPVAAGIIPPIYLALRVLRFGAEAVVPLIIWVVLVVVLYSSMRTLFVETLLRP